MKSGKNKVWDRCPKCGATVEIEVPDTRHPREKKRDRRLYRRRWLTRIAILLLLVLAGVNGWMVMRYSDELRTVESIEDESDGAMSILTAPVGPARIREWVRRHGLPFPRTVIQIEGPDDSRGSYRTTDRLLELASDLPGLLYLNLEDPDSSEITDQGMTHLRAMRLVHLSIGGPKITDTGLYYLRDMTSLRELYLADSPQLTDKGLAYLTGLKNLTRLVIEDIPRMTDAGLAPMRNMKSLKRLTIGHASHLTGEGFVHLTVLGGLTQLRIYSLPAMTDAGLAQLANVENLEQLSISACPQLGDEGLAHLAGLRNLRSLRISHLPQVTENGIASLQQSLPGTELMIEGERVAVEE